MSTNRKLQGEIDRVLKRIQEGIVEFGQIWDKVQQATSQSLKEKHEADLKKEIKKLQRHRDQVKSWAASNEVKNKKPLLDARRDIEQEMERFKVLEKETKTKAYSKEGLSQAAKRIRQDKNGPKKEVIEWIDEARSRLKDTHADMDKELDKLRSKKLKGKESEDFKKLQEQADRHKFHLTKLLRTKKRLKDDGITLDQAETIKDGVEYYLSNYEDPDFQDDEEVYEALDEAGGEDDGEDSGSDDDDDGSGDDDASDDAGSASDASGAGSDSEAAESDEDEKPVKKREEKKAPAKTPVKAKPAPAPAVVTPAPVMPVLSANSLPQISANMAAPKAPAKVDPIAEKAKAALLAAQTAAKKPKAASPSPTPVASPLPLPTPAKVPAPIATAQTLPAPAKVATPTPAPAKTPVPAKAATPTPTPVTVATPSAMAASSPATSTSTAAPKTPAKPKVPTPVSIPTPQPKASETLANVLKKGQQEELRKATGTPSKPAASPEPAKAPTPAAAKVATPASTAKKAATPSDKKSAEPASSPLAGINTSLDDYELLKRMLEPSLRNVPEAGDTERPKVYTPRNPARTHPCFPSTPATVFDDPAIFEKFGTDTLFFIFYFQQGTPHQYLAARELKKQSWRYHKGFLTWFQRGEDPKITTEEFEQGTYVYFDYDSGWIQRIKTDFTFEYRHLEDELTVPTSTGMSG